MAERDDFYVGYRAHAPAGLRPFLRRTAAGLVILAPLVAGLLAGLQGPFDPGTFEFGVVRDFTGVLHERPYPLLRVDDGDEDGGTTTFFLVAFGKHGAEPEVAGLDGRRVRLEGSLIQRQGQTMVEVVSGSVEAVGPASPTPPGARRELGVMTLRGEIVDSKCFLGVMKPGRGKPHRACATLCIRGGIPPVLRVETRAGDFRHLLLTDTAGGAVNDRILDRIAVPVEVIGRVLRDEDLLILETDPSTIRILGAGG